MEIKPGKYIHYKGGKYEVIGIAKHSETLEDIVVYKALYNSDEFGSNSLWVRPSKMFFEVITVNGNKVPRFKYIE